MWQRSDELKSREAEESPAKEDVVIRGERDDK